MNVTPANNDQFWSGNSQPWVRFLFEKLEEENRAHVSTLFGDMIKFSKYLEHKSNENLWMSVWKFVSNIKLALAFRRVVINVNALLAFTNSNVRETTNANTSQSQKLLQEMSKKHLLEIAKLVPQDIQRLYEAVEDLKKKYPELSK